MVETKRKLASVQRIAEIKPIPGADKICAFRCRNWWVVDQKDKYKVGDLCVYCELGAWLPHNLAPFLSKGKEPRVYEGIVGERLRSIKLRGQISQGLILPMTVLDEWDSGEMITIVGEDYYQEGEDVSEVLGIVKWERPIPAQLQGQIKGNFPPSIPKTDQTRIQSFSEQTLKEFAEDHLWTVSEKADGTSSTYYLSSDGEFHVCSRNMNLKETEGNTYWEVAKKYEIERRMREADLFGFAIQGEICGPGIQKNIYELPDHRLFVYNVFEETSQTYVINSKEIADELLLPHVPILYNEFSFDPQMEEDACANDAIVQPLLKMAERKSILNPKTEQEGLVFRSIDDPNTSFKVISNKFLLKHGE